jgi:hypothetical protein
MKLKLKDLFDYFKKELDDGKYATDFSVRAELEDGKIHFYIHPANKGGSTIDFYEDGNKDDFIE